MTNRACVFSTPRVPTRRASGLPQRPCKHPRPPGTTWPESRSPAPHRALLAPVRALPLPGSPRPVGSPVRVGKDPWSPGMPGCWAQRTGSLSTPGALSEKQTGEALNRTLKKKKKKKPPDHALPWGTELSEQSRARGAGDPGSSPASAPLALCTLGQVTPPL